MTMPSKEPLTDRQAAILKFIVRHSEERGYPPTIREICEEFGIRSTNGVNDHLKAIERKGWLERGALKSRALVVTPDEGDTAPAPARLRGLPANDDGMIEIPLVGKVAAGAPILAEENLEGSVKIDSFLLGRGAKPIFALRVQGDSMIGDGIFDGDYIFVKKQLVAEQGQIIVAMIEGEATVKRFFRESGRIRLQPSNPRLKPIYVRADEFRDAQILGAVVGVYRKV